MRSRMQPLIAIFGTTGVGKSKLGIELALALAQSEQNGWKGARIINADAMQVYDGMDILTNKAPMAERRGVEHLLMSFKKPWEQYVVGQWVQDAIAKIEETHQRNQIPIVVGGTAYWMQHLLFPRRLITSDSATSLQSVSVSDEIAKSVAALPQNLSELFHNLTEDPPSASVDPGSSFSLHSLLAALDPAVAARWHWRDTRKVHRSIKIIKERGQRVSEILTEQAQEDLQPRYRTLCFWLYASASSLNPRLDMRVHEMIEQGVLDEIRQLRQLSFSISQSAGVASDPNAIKPDYTRGLYQSIGYKEFDKYLASQNPSEQLYSDAIERMKLSTRQYAKRQISWIRNKLLPAIYTCERSKIQTYLLDASQLGEQWTSNVRNITEQITNAFLSDRELPDPLSLSEIALEMLTVKKRAVDPISVLVANRRITCKVCTVNDDQPVTFEEKSEWEGHQKTRLHRRLARKKSSETIEQ